MNKGEVKCDLAVSLYKLLSYWVCLWVRERKEEQKHANDLLHGQACL